MLHTSPNERRYAARKLLMTLEAKASVNGFAIGFVPCDDTLASLGALALALVLGDVEKCAGRWR